MIVKIFNNGWGDNWPVTQLEQKIVRHKLKELSYDKDIILSNTANLLKYLIDNSDKTVMTGKRRRIGDFDN